MDKLTRTADILASGGGPLNSPQAMVSISEAIEDLTGFLRRQYPVFAIIIPAVLAAGLVYLAVVPAQYTAFATLLIDGNRVRVLQNQQPTISDAALDSAQVESQVEVLKSHKIALSVIKELRLDEDPEFVGAPQGLVQRLFSVFSFRASGEQFGPEMTKRARAYFSQQRYIARVNRTYILDVGFSSRDPERAAQIANAIAEAYIVDQLEAKYQAIRRASAWLQDRIKELKQQSLVADMAVLEYKEKNKIVDLGGGTARPDGSSRLIGEQQLAELNSQLMSARVSTSEAKARLERIEELLKQDIGDAAVADSLRSEVINRLRNQYLDLAAREAGWSTRYGQDHMAAANLRSQMAELKRAANDELGRIAAGYRSDYEIARTRQDNLERALADLVSEGQITNRDRLGLSELESSAKAYRTIYDTFLQRYTEAIQQQSFPITEARVISTAEAPDRKSTPVARLVLSIAMSIGLVTSFGIAALREAIDTAFRTTRQVENTIGVPCLSVLPAAEPARSQAWPLRFFRATQRRKPPEDRRTAAPAERPDAQTRGAVRYAIADPLMRRVLDEPFSSFTEAVRAIKVAAELQSAVRQSKVIGVTSTLPREGKSTVACNLATLMADAGKRTILVDADLRRPALVRYLEPKPLAGLTEALSADLAPEQVIGIEPATGLNLLPVLADKPISHADEVVSSPAFKQLIARFREQYDYIIVDLPPIVPAVDVRLAAQVIDSLVFVVEWGSTKIKVVRRHLEATPEIRDRLLGVVLNKANTKTFGKFEQESVHYTGYYAQQGYIYRPEGFLQSGAGRDHRWRGRRQPFG